MARVALWLSLTMFFCTVFVMSVECQDKERDFVRELTYRQREYESQHAYLSEKEAGIAQELNSDISLQNAEPNAATLQRIDNLKARILEYLQDQIKNDRDYISYLEMRLSELVDYKFPTLKAIQKLDEAQVAPQVAPKNKPETVKEEQPVPQEYKHERVPLSTSE